MKKEYEVIPSAKRLIGSLRDMGYDFSSAVADLIDNSIAAEATEVHVIVEFAGADSFVKIADNGTGMAPSALREALRYGAEREYEADDLGKFGLGLKTASMSQCQKLTVATRNSQQRSIISAYSWDLLHVEKTNRWEILTVDSAGYQSDFFSSLKNAPGTVVIWQKLDRILSYKDANGDRAQSRLGIMCRDLEEHLSMVFHRFLSGAVRGKKLKIFLNGNQISPWDPFAIEEPNTKKLEEVVCQVSSGLDLIDVRVQPFILPHQSKFSTSAAHVRAGGPKKWNRQQGFYIYRANRLIQSGGWSNIRTVDEHTKLARIAIHFPTALDAAFKINVAKMRVQLPNDLRDAMDKTLTRCIKAANEAYRTGSKTAIKLSVLDIQGISIPSKETNEKKSKNSSSNENVRDKDIEEKPEVESFSAFAALAEKCATQAELPVLKRIIYRMKSKYKTGN